jgi:uncharacterized Zn-binding protein involved in type VI secretion
MSGTSRGALELAGVGHRITHKRRLPDPRQLTLCVVELAAGALAKREAEGPVTGALVGMAVSKATGLVLRDEGGESPECPSPCGTIKEGSPNTFLGKKAVAVALVDAQEVPCERHEDKPIRKGAEDVWVNGLPVARRTDETCCGAHVGEGEPTVLVGAQTQTCRSLDMSSAHAVMHQVLDTLFGPAGAPSSGSKLGLALAGGSGFSLEQLLPESVHKAMDAALGSEIGQRLLDGDVKGAVAAVRESLGF